MIIWADGGTSVLNRFLMIVVGRRLRAPQFTNAMTSSRGGGGNWPALNIILSFREPRSQLGNWDPRSRDTAHERGWTIEEMNIKGNDVRDSQFCLFPFFVFQMTLCKNGDNARCLSEFIEICLNVRCKTSKGRLWGFLIRSKVPCIFIYALFNHTQTSKARNYLFLQEQNLTWSPRRETLMLVHKGSRLLSKFSSCHSPPPPSSQSRCSRWWRCWRPPCWPLDAQRGWPAPPHSWGPRTPAHESAFSNDQKKWTQCM